MVFNCCLHCFCFYKCHEIKVPPNFALEESQNDFFAGSRRGLFKLSPFNAGLPIDDGFFSGGKDPLKWQIDTGEGFLRDAPDDAMGDMMGSGMALAKARVFGGGQEKMWWMKCDLK